MKRHPTDWPGVSRRDLPRAGGGALASPRTADIRAFTLLEVMIALAIFFMAVFAILGAVSQGLQGARSLQVEVPDISRLMPELLLTEPLEDFPASGDFEDDFPGFQWESEVIEVATNGLFEVQFRITGLVQGRPYQSISSVLVWRPASGQLRPPGRRR